MQNIKINRSSEITPTIRGTTSLVLLVIIAFGWLMAASFGFIRGGSELMLLAIVWSLAAFLVGSLIGFLFGLPKVGASNGQSNPNPPLSPLNAKSVTLNQQVSTGSRLIVSRNLEEIADWLTKIIVGVSLVEFTNLSRTLRKVAGSFSTDSSVADTFVLPVLIFNLGIGLITAYMLLRLYLSEAMGKADNSLDGLSIMSAGVKRELENNPIQPNLDNLDVAKFQSQDETSGKETDAQTVEKEKNLNQSASTVASVSINSLENPESLFLWARAQSQMGNFESAANAYLQAISKKNDPSYHLEYALTLASMKKSNVEIINALLKAVKAIDKTTDLEVKKNIYKSLTFYLLYVKNGYKDAIKYAEQYLKEGGLPSGRIQINLACAYGQYASEIGKDSKKISDLSDLILNAIRSAQADDGKKWDSLLKALLKGDDQDNNDLKIFKETSDSRVRDYINAL
jgi:tetratricopeptide (TPR) repeat protein